MTEKYFVYIDNTFDKWLKSTSWHGEKKRNPIIDYILCLIYGKREWSLISQTYNNEAGRRQGRRTCFEILIPYRDPKIWDF